MQSMKTAEQVMHAMDARYDDEKWYCCRGRHAICFLVRSSVTSAGNTKAIVDLPAL